jgi:hypothetical protein
VASESVRWVAPLLLVLLAVPVVHAAPGGAGFELACPPVVAASPAQPPTCPLYVLDQEDLFGQPDLVADARDPSVLAFSAMHGGAGLHPLPSGQPPSPRSRDASVHQPHTTFVTRDGGSTWHDYPYDPPTAILPASTLPGVPVRAGQAREAYGEDNAMALDGQGRVALAALYASRDAGATASTPYRYTVALWREGKPAAGMDYFNGLTVLPLPADSRADSLHLTYVPDADALVALWRQEDAPRRVTLAGAWANGTSGAWTPLDANLTPQGCASLSRPFAEGASLVFACGSRLVSLDPRTSRASDLGALPLPDLGQVGLAPLDGPGRYAAWAAGVQDGHPSLVVSFRARNGSAWSAPRDVGPDVQPPGLGSQGALLEARATAAAYAPGSGSLHLVFETRRATDAQPGIAKTLVALGPEGVRASLDLALGQVRRVDVSPTATGLGEDVYDDLHDSLVVRRDPAGGAPRELLAYGDYGFVRFAEVREHGFAPPVVPLAAQAPPVPAAAPGGIPVLVGIPAGVLAGTAMARVAMARRQQTVEVRDE